MATQGDSLIKKTQKGLSILAFETTKQSRILKKRMRIAALQKETKADLRDLGNLVYNALINAQQGILEEEEVKILVENIQGNKAEVERLRDAIARLGRARKHFEDEEATGEESGEGSEPAPRPDEEPALVVEPAPPATQPKRDSAGETGRELEQAVNDLVPEGETPAEVPGDDVKRTAQGAEEEQAPSVPPAPGTDPGHPKSGQPEEPKP